MATVVRDTEKKCEKNHTLILFLNNFERTNYLNLKKLYTFRKKNNFFIFFSKIDKFTLIFLSYNEFKFFMIFHQFE